MKNFKKEDNYYFFDKNQNYVLFENAEEAWFWYCRYDERNGFKLNNSSNRIIRVCNLDDIYLVVSKLYLAKKISERHLKTLIKYGRMQIVPDERIEEEKDEALWWSDAMDKIEIILKNKGIVKCNDQE